MTVAFATFPVRLDGAVTGEAVEILDRLVVGLEDNLALLFAGVLLLSIGSAMSSGGGRELLSRPEASIHPSARSPTTSAPSPSRPSTSRGSSRSGACWPRPPS